VTRQEMDRRDVAAADEALTRELEEIRDTLVRVRADLERELVESTNRSTDLQALSRDIDERFAVQADVFAELMRHALDSEEH
jgi:hypothetical protein